MRGTRSQSLPTVSSVGEDVVAFADVLSTLGGRMRQSGLAEKSSRGQAG